MHGADFVDDVDRLVRQFAVIDIARGQFHGGLDRVRRIFHLVMTFEGTAEPREDLDRVFDRRFVHIDLLEPAEKRAILFEVIAKLLVRRRTDAPDCAARKGGLQQVGGIHGSAGCRARANDGVNLVDEQDRMGELFKFADDGFQPLFEIATIARPGKQGAHIKRIDDGGKQDFGHIAFDDLAREAFRNGRLADAGLTHIKRVVLGTAAQNLHGPVNFGTAADQRIDLAGARLFVQIDAELLERGFLLVLALCFLLLFFLVLCPLHFACLGDFRSFAHAVRNEADRIEAAHVLLLQEIDGIALALGKQRHQNICTRDVVPSGRLDVQNRALDHALETACRRGIRIALDFQRFQFGIQIVGNRVLELAKVHAARDHDL